MSATAPQPASDPAEILAGIAEGLCEAIAAHCENERAESVFKRLAWTQLRRLAAWLAALLADFRAGLLPPAPVAARRAPVDAASFRRPAAPPRPSARGRDLLAFHHLGLRPSGPAAFFATT